MHVDSLPLVPLGNFVLALRGMQSLFLIIIVTIIYLLLIVKITEE